ncbi:endonuclease MutS2 [Pseudalkalibacillus sp. NRS-1564]|uniref:endonuclease MutS2 n=1 Tax=Pseudalkalibacillus sp. NRS-1564 TaxID=3233900 RepID=UPI003D2DB5B2
MNEQTMVTLEFDKIRSEVAHYALSEEAKSEIQKMRPLHDKEVVQNRLNETTEAKEIIKKSSSVPLHGLHGIIQVMKQLNKGVPLRPDQLITVLDLIESGRKLKQFMTGKEWLAPTISTYIYSLYEITDLEEELKRAIRNGEIDDAASKELGRIRKKITVYEERVKEKLNHLLRSSSKRKALQDTIISDRNGHYVVAVKKEYRNQIKGTVHDQSSSGSTVYIEPEEVRKVQMELNEVKADEYLEEQRILSRLTGEVERYAQEISINIETMTHYDYIFAKAKYSVAIDGDQVKLSSEPILELQNGRHPLLSHEAVPLSLELGKAYKGLVITGPNTGGKTVSIKTVGLLSMMVQCGLHIPADESSVFGMFGSILVDIGDGQSIEQSLSTFSSRISNIISILQAAAPDSLVILDELGSGTDPGEGMGIAVSILEQLNRLGSTILSTTHYSEMKNFASAHPDFENGSMEFDPETLRPTFKLRMGVPGESQAFAIALRLGMHPNIIERAHEITYQEKQSYREGFNQKDHWHYEQQLKSKKVEKPRSQKKVEVEKIFENYSIGDSVAIPSLKEKGIVYQPMDDFGNLIVMINGQKETIHTKRVKLLLPASELYPENYDFDILFETVENRKKKKLMNRKHIDGVKIDYEEY